MGREIRLVPANWEHPRYTEDNAPSSWRVGEYIPLFEDYEGALKEFADAITEKGLTEAIEYHGEGPRRDDYVDYKGQPATWFQVYETVSEGTPVTPPFATREELVEYLVQNGDFWDQLRVREGWQSTAGWKRASAEAFAACGYCPTGIVKGGVFYAGPDALVQ